MQNPVVVSIEINQACPLDCPYCYSKPRRSQCRWSREDLATLIREATETWSPVAIVYGDGEPLLTPHLTGWAMRKALEAGAVQTGFTTSGTPHTRLGEVEREYGGPLTEPSASVTVSIDPHKARTQPRCTLGDAAIARAWGRVSKLLHAPERPPSLLCAIEYAHSRGWTVVANLLVTREVALMAPLLATLAREGLVSQVNLLAPKPMRGLLPPGFIPVARRVATLLAGAGARVTVEGAMRQLLEPGVGCDAGRRLVSVTACREVKPCSFHPRGVEWRPGTLSSIAESLLRNYSGLRRGPCPYLGLPA